MALQREQIDTLLAEIDGVLSKANPRLPWVMSSEVTQQRQTLERIRHYLKGLQSESALSSLDSSGYHPWSDIPTTNLEVASGQLASGQLASGQLASGQLMESANSPQAALMLSQQMMQAFTQDLAQLRSSLLQPLHSETVRLQQQRDSLLQEIRQLERQRQQHTLIQQRASQEQQVYDFLQGLMDRLQERLSQQINQVVGTLAAQAKLGDSSLVLDSQGGSPLFPQEAGLPPLPPAQRVEQLQMLQARADQVMMTLDTTLRAFAEALQQNIQSYESSLSQGLDKMHSMGQQGEAIVANLVQKLADQVSGQVLSGTLPPLPASPGSRLQGFNVQNTSLQSTSAQAGVQTGTQAGAQAVGSGLGASQNFATYTSQDSSDRTNSRFGVPLSRAAKLPTLVNSGTSSTTAPKSIADSGATISRKKESSADAPTDLDLDFDLLEQLEQTTVDSPASQAPVETEDQIQAETQVAIQTETQAETQAETQVGNEELDAFYASLFGDSPRKIEPIALKLDAEPDTEGQTPLELESELESDLESELQSDLESELEGLQLDSQTEEPAPIPSLEQDDLEADPFADLGAGLADDEEALDLELLDEELESPGAEAPTAGATPELPQTMPPAQQTGIAIDPLAALSVELQAPFQGVTELSPQQPELASQAPPPEDSVTDPLMADLEEALQSLGSPASAPEVTATLAGTVTGFKKDSQPLTPAPRETDTIPPEDVITTLTDVLPAEKSPQRAEVSLIPTPPPRSVPRKPQEEDLEDEIYHLAHPEELLLVPEDGEEETHIALQVEEETRQQLTEDLSNLERNPPVDTEDLFNLDRLGEGDGFGEDQGEDLFGDSFTPPQEQESSAETSGLLEELLEEELLEESSPPESLLPEAEDNGLDWMLEEAVGTPAPVAPVPLNTTSDSPTNATSPVSLDLFGNSAFEQNLEEDLDLDSSFEETSELSLDRMTDWFGDAADPESSTESPAESSAEEPFLIDHLFADLPDAEKKNDDWSDWPL